MNTFRRNIVHHLVAASLLLGTGSAVVAADAPVGMSAKPDPQMQAVLDQLKKLGAKPVETLTPQQARVQPTPADAVKAVLKNENKSTEPEPVANVADEKIEGAAGSIPVRIYTPQGKGPFPVVVYYHGGGWVIADLDTYDASGRALANAAQAIVVSSHYRQAPEHKFPAAHEDALAAYKWVLTNAANFNGDPKRIAVAGESAGGNLAATVALQAKQQGLQMPLHQLLIYPIAGNNLNTPSYRNNAGATPLSKAGMAWFFKNYENSPSEGDSELISLVDKADLKGLPPATIITAQIDPLMSDGKKLADKLKQAGVAVTYMNYEGVTHEFFGMAPVVDKAKDAQQLAGKSLREAFSNGGKRVGSN